MKYFLLFLIILLCTTPITADKNKGLFSGDILQADLDAFTANTSDTPSYAEVGTPEQTNLQDIAEWIDIGKTQLKSGNWAAAEEAFSKVTSQAPVNNDGWEGYLLAIRGGGDFDKLLAASEDATKKNPGYSSAWKYKGIALSGLDKSAEALAAFDKVLEMDPSNYQAWYYKGIAFDNLKQYNEAVNAYDQVLKINPEYAKGWNNKGVALLYLERFDEAITALEQAVAIDPSYTAAVTNKNLAADEKKESSLGSVDLIDDSSLFVPSSTPSPITAVITMAPTMVPTPIPTPFQTPVLTPAPVTPMVIPTQVYPATVVGTTGTKSSRLPEIEWQKSFGGSGGEGGESIAQTTDGGYILTGKTNSNDGDVTGNHGDSFDVWVVKLDNSENIIWQRCLGGYGNDFGSSIAQTTDGGYILIGYTRSSDGDVIGNHFAYTSIWVVKLDNSGNIIWQRCLGGYGSDFGSSIAQTTDGGYILTGYAESNDGDVTGNHGMWDVWVVKLDNSGNIIWQRCLGGSNYDYGSSIAQTTDGGYILTGYAESNDGDVTGNHGDSDVWVVKLNNSGNIIWQRCLGGSKWDHGSSIAQTTDGGYILTGYTISNDGDVTGNHGEHDVWVVKLDNSGNIIWQRCLGGSIWDDGLSITQTTDGGYILTGRTGSNDGDVTGNHGDHDVWVVKLDNSGNIIWQRCLGGSDGDDGNSIVQTIDGGYILTGLTYSNNGDVTGNHGDHDVWVVKLSP